MAEEQQVERKRGVADMLSFEPLGTKLDVEVCPKMSFCCLFIDGKRQMKLVSNRPLDSFEKTSIRPKGGDLADLATAGRRKPR